ncbi:MAG: PQQ-binding-like beta-propeller repeat protein [Planctomycetes bacterium]|nr:PQQ-binding-like beta-propeller repeat protein [Planctomycetota bacterium]
MYKRAGFSQSNIPIWIIIRITLVIAMLVRGAHCQESRQTLSERQKNWPRFRGLGGLGISHYSNVPISWNGKTGEGILWRTAIPSQGHSSPVVWGNHIFLTGADKEKLGIYCVDAASGSLLWQREVKHVQGNESESLDIPEETGFAACTPATDGERVYAIFANGYICCYDFDGKQIWAKHLDPLDNMYGHASSLLVYRDLLLIQLDQGQTKDRLSKIMALKVMTGETVWSTPRKIPCSWATPIIIDTGKREELITCGNPWVISYKPATGEELWRAKCLGGDVALSPVYADGLVFVANAMAMRAAILPGGQGDVTTTNLVWSVDDVAADVCSPLVSHGLLFLLESSGYLQCYDAKTGKTVWEKDLRDEFMASPSVAGNNIYLLGEDGVMIIIRVGNEYKEISRCELGERCTASPTFQSGRIYIRGKENLYCIVQ